MQFVAIWGNWNHLAPNTYETETDIITESKITENEGYEPEDIKNIKSLGLGKMWDSPLGNHKIIRVL